MSNTFPTNLKIVAIIQARMGSTRLPGKTMAYIGDKPLLAHVIERVRASNIIDGIIVATTDLSEDLPILELAAKYGASTYAGSADDVLDRLYQAAKRDAADIIVRVTSDDPFKDPEIMDKIIACLIDLPDLDYASNTLDPTYPEGLDIEAFKFTALERAWLEAKLPSEREHVTPYIWKNPNIFKLASIKHDINLSHLRWTIDYEDDLCFAREIYARLSSKGIFFMRDILKILELEQGLININKNFERNLGYKSSLRNDRNIN